MAMGDPLVKEVHFHNPRLSKVGVETLEWHALRRRLGAAMGAPERVDFFLVLLVTRGQGRHRVDFVEYDLKPGQVLLVRPGQVQHWRDNPRLEAELVLIAPQALAPSVQNQQSDVQLLALEDWPAISQPDRSAFAEVLVDAARLRAEVARFEGSAIEQAIVRHVLSAMLLRLARARSATQAAQPQSRELQIHGMFARELERGVEKRLSVTSLARRLGYSESTVTRACLAATGRTAKELVDLRTVLEAKRLLVHSAATVAEIGSRLRFSEPTNFVKFFRRMEGATPLEFRAANGAARGE